LSRNILNVVPAVFFLLAFTGGSLLSTLGFGAASQIQNPEYFDTSNVDFSIFNNPSWNAAYYLQNLMDQFTAGLNAPFQNVFNITRIFPDNDDLATTSDQYPFAYYKTGVSDSWEYNANEARSGDWELSSSQALKYGLEEILSEDNPQVYSDMKFETQNINPTLRNNTMVTLMIEQEINTSSSTWREPIPVAWSGTLGAYIDPNTINLGGSSCSTLGFGSNCNVYENINTVTTNFSQPQNVEFEFNGLSTSSSDTLLTWEQDYLTPNYLQIQQTALPASLYPIVFGDSWQAILDKYTQIPNSVDNTLPSSVTNDTGTFLVTDYHGWAPSVYDWKNEVDKNLTAVDSVFNIALAYAQSIAPTTAGKPEDRASFTLGIDPFLFDEDAWLGVFSQGLTVAPHPTPAPTENDPKDNEEYNQWFFDRGGGIGIHFASALTMMLRLNGIPSRMIDGYAGGNTTIRSDKTVMQAHFRHAWVEVLVPMRNPLTGSYYSQWVIFDPVATIFLGQTPYDVSSTSELYFVDPYQYATGSTDIFDIYANMTYRVGVDYKHDIGGGNWVFDGVYDRSTESKQTLLSPDTGGGVFGSSHNGHVRVGVYTAAANKLGDIPGGFYPVPNTPVTFALTWNNATVVPWGYNPHDPGNLTTVYSVNVVSDINGLAETEFIYDADPNSHGSGSFNFVAMFGDIQCTQVNDCVNNNADKVAAISDNNVLAKQPIDIVIGDGDAYNIDTVTFQATSSPVWSPISLLPFWGPSDNVNYTYWEPSTALAQQTKLSQKIQFKSVNNDKLNLNSLKATTSNNFIQNSNIQQLTADENTARLNKQILGRYFLLLTILGLIVMIVIISKKKERNWLVR
ncbi:MAG: transglutaminase-like domain-containing protein, partial [Candidatus Hodarchaeales archaeon]